MTVTLDDEGRLVSVRGDRDHPLTEGYACLAGLQSPEMHNSERRVREPLKRLADGSFATIPVEQAYDEIAAALETIIADSGPAAVAGFRGTANYWNMAALPMLPAWLHALGSPSFFTTMTVDQSAKWVTADRLGTWHAGRENFADSDVMLLIGGNPVVSATVMGFPNANPVKQLKQARARGLKLIVIDPRRTETAALADLVLQPLPGEDAAIAAGLLRIILTEGWEDHGFCAQHVEGMDTLRRAVDPFSISFVAARAGVTEEELRDVAEAFARTGKRGFALTGTGPDMGSHSNLAEHLIECLNVVCGRFRRAGDRVVNPVFLGRRRALHAEVVPPARSWERGPQSRVRGGVGMLQGQMMSCLLADEIMTPGEGQVRSLFVLGGNPMGALPDPDKTARALQSLDLLVTIDPFMTATARLSHYVLPPKLQYERPDFGTFNDLLPAPFFQYTPALAQPPKGAVDEWQVFWELGRRLGLPLSIGGEKLDMDRAPQTEEILAILTRHAQVSWDEIVASRGGVLKADVVQHVEPARPGAQGRFQVMPGDVEEEIGTLLSEQKRTRLPYRLAVRRMRGVINTAYHDLPRNQRRQTFNPAYMNGDDMAVAGLRDGDEVTIVSPHGRIPAIVAVDTRLRPGVVSMSHGWGSVLPGERADYRVAGASTNFLIGGDEGLEPINAMAQLTGVPVDVLPGWRNAG